jgi:hypothetical protein
MILPLHSLLRSSFPFQEISFVFLYFNKVNACTLYQFFMNMFSPTKQMLLRMTCVPRLTPHYICSILLCPQSVTIYGRILPSLTSSDILSSGQLYCIRKALLKHWTMQDCRLMSSGKWHRVVWYIGTNDSEKRAALKLLKGSFYLIHVIYGCNIPNFRCFVKYSGELS